MSQPPGKLESIGQLFQALGCALMSLLGLLILGVIAWAFLH